MLMAEPTEWLAQIRELRAATRNGILGCDSVYLVLEGEAPFHWVVAPPESREPDATLCGRYLDLGWLRQPEAGRSSTPSETSFCGYPVVEELCTACMLGMARVARGVAKSLGAA